MDLRDYLRILRQRWMVIVLVTMSISGVGLFFTLQEPTRYTANAEIILRDNPYRFFRSGEYPSFFPDHFSRSTRAQLIRRREVLSYAVLTSLSDIYRNAQPWDKKDFNEKRLEDSIRNGKLKDLYHSRDPSSDDVHSGKKALIALEDAISELRAGLTINQEEKSEIITISYQDIDSGLAIKIVNGIANAFEKISQIRQERGINQAIDFMKKTKTSRINDQERKEAELKTKRAEKETLTKGKDMDKYTVLVAELKSLQENKREMQLEWNRLDIEIKTISELTSGEGSVPINLEDVFSQRTQIESDIESIEIKLARMKQKYTNKWPGISQLENDIAFLETRLKTVHDREQTTARLNLMIRARNLSLRKTQIEKKIALNKQDQDSMKEEKGAFDDEFMKKLFRIENEEQELETRVISLNESIRSLDDYSQKLNISRHMIVKAVDRMDPAKRALPITKRGFRTFPLIFLTALIVGIAFAYLLEYLNTSIRTEHDVKRYVNLPLYGMVMKIREENERLLLHTPPKSPLSELFNTISAMIEAQARDNGSKTFMIASPNAGEGKSTVTTNIAIALARGGARVTLIDADLRRAVLHKFFNVNNQEGLSNYLSQQNPQDSDFNRIIHPTEIENLRVIPAGPHPANPVLVLKSGSFQKLLEKLTDQADFVLIDVPPVRIAVDTILLTPQVQNTILLTSAGETNKEDVAFAKNLIESAKGNLVGCILNKAITRGEGYYYYYDYYRYYGRH